MDDVSGPVATIDRRPGSSLDVDARAGRAVMVIWLAGIVIDRLSFAFESDALWALSLAAAGVALIWPQRWVMVGALVVDAAVLWSHMPDLGNHLVLRFFVDLLVIGRIAAGRTPPLRTFRWMIVALYVIAAVHKVNSSFLDPAVSCGAEVSRLALTEHGLPSGGAAIAWASIALTFVFEGGLPVLLLVPITRKYAVAAGLVFHTALTVVPIIGVASFSILMAAAYLSIGSDALVSRVDDAAARMRHALVSRVPAPLVVTGVAASAAAAWAAAEASPFRVVQGTRYLSLALGLALTAWCLAALRRPGSWPSRGRATEHGVIAPLLVATMVLAALLPYAGGRTQAAFSMFSNLRTEQAPNHLFFDLPDWFGYQDDLVEVDPARTTLVREVASPGTVTPGYELGRRLELLADDAAGVLVFQDAAGTHSLDLAAARLRFPPPNPVEAKLFRMKSIEPSGPVACAH